MSIFSEDGKIAIWCSESSRFMAGGPSKVFARFCGMEPPGMEGVLSGYKGLIVNE